MFCDLKPKTMRYTNGCLTFVAVLFLGGILLMSVISSFSYSSGIHFMEAAINWIQEPVEDITVVDPKTGLCSAPSTNAYSKQFKGLKEGCDCTAVGGKVTTGICSATQVGCQSVKKVPPTVLQNWVDSTGTPLRLCFKRTSGYYFFKNYLKTSACRDPTKEKMCGGSNPLFAFCVPNASQCPVQSISTSQINVSDQQIGTTGLWMQRNMPDKSPLSELNIGTSGICYTNQFQYAPAGYISYPLLESDKTTSCQIDPKYSQVQQINSKDFYIANNLDGNSYVGLTTGKTTGLFQRPFVQWNMSCRQGAELEDLINMAVSFSSDANSHSSYFKIAIANCVVVGVYGLLLMFGCFTNQLDRKWCTVKECCKVESCCCPCLNKGCTFSGCCTLRSPSCTRKWWMRKDYNQKCSDCCYLVDPLHLILLIVKFVLDILMVILALKNVFSVKAYSSQLASIAALNCSDTMVNLSLSETSINIDQVVRKLDSAITAAMLIYFILSLIAVYIYISNQVERRRQILKNVMDLKQVRVLAENDQTIPTIHSSNDLSFQKGNNSHQIEMSQDKKNNYVNTSNLPLNNQAFHQQIQMGQPQYPPVQGQNGAYPNMYPVQQQGQFQQPIMYPPQFNQHPNMAGRHY